MQDLPWSVSAHLSVPLVGRHQLLQHLGEARQPEQVPEGHVVDMSWTCRGRVVDMSWTRRWRVVDAPGGRLAGASGGGGARGGTGACGPWRREETRREEKRREEKGLGEEVMGGAQGVASSGARGASDVSGRCLGGV